MKEYLSTYAKEVIDGLLNRLDHEKEIIKDLRSEILRKDAEIENLRPRALDSLLELFRTVRRM